MPSRADNAISFLHLKAELAALNAQIDDMEVTIKGLRTEKLRSDLRASLLLEVSLRAGLLLESVQATVRNSQHWVHRNEGS
jgi:hypothetical protein